MMLSMCISVWIWKYPLADDSLTDQTFMGGEEYLVTIDWFSGHHQEMLVTSIRLETLLTFIYLLY